MSLHAIPPHLRHLHRPATTATTATTAPIQVITPALPTEDQATASTAAAPASVVSTVAADPWQVFLEAKVATDLEKKRAALVQKAQRQKEEAELSAKIARGDMARSQPTSLDPAAQAAKTITPWALPLGKIVTNVKHSHFQVNVGSSNIDDFQNFIQRKAPVAGKRYVAVAQPTLGENQNVKPLAEKSYGREVPQLKSNQNVALVNTQSNTAAVKMSEYEAAPTLEISLVPKPRDFTSLELFQPIAVPRSERHQTRASTPPEPYKSTATPLSPQEGVFSLPKQCFGSTSIPVDEAISTRINIDVEAQDPLPEGWRVGGEREGRIYYANDTAQTTSWIRPAVVVPDMLSLVAPAPSSSGGWPVPSELKVDNTFHSSITDAEQYNAEVAGQRLSEKLVADNWGRTPTQKSDQQWEVSDTNVEDQVKENVRGAQGIDATEELLDWDNSWLPPPCIWEDRGNFNNSYVAEYIAKDWVPIARHECVKFDMETTPGFLDGTCAVDDIRLAHALIHPRSLPTVESNFVAQRKQTTQDKMNKWIAKTKKCRRDAKSFAQNSASRHEEIATLEVAPNPYTPAIDIYLRPATISDVPGIMEIYNHYITNTFATEDSEVVDTSTIKNMIDHQRKEKLPCIVAVKGRIPTSPQSKLGGGQQSNKVTLPQYEAIAGFAYAATHNYGLKGLRSGRSRATLDLELYVHHEYLRKRVGRSLLDRMLQCVSFGYGANDGYDWLNPRGDPVYNKGGVTIYHTMLLHIPVITGSVPPKWQIDLLASYWFKKGVVLDRVGRSQTTAVQGPAKFLDMVIFTKELALVSEFGPHT